MARHGENIRKRTDGRWEARIILDYSNAGKAHYKYLYGKTYREVKEKRNALITEKKFARQQQFTLEKTFGELLDDWLVYVKTDVKESTFAKYAFDVEQHIKPELGQIRLYNLKTEYMDAFIRKKLTSGQLRKEGHTQGCYEADQRNKQDGCAAQQHILFSFVG